MATKQIGREVDVSELSQVLAAARQRQVQIMEQIHALTAEQGEIDAVLNGTVLAKPMKKSGKKGPRAVKGAQKAAILALFDKNNGTLTTKQAKEGTKAFNTDASVLLMRMSKDGLIRSESRGTWLRTKKVA